MDSALVEDHVLSAEGEMTLGQFEVPGSPMLGVKCPRLRLMYDFWDTETLSLFEVFDSRISYVWCRR